MAVDDIIIFNNVYDVEQSPPATVPEVNDVLWADDGEGAPVDPSFRITTVDSLGGFYYDIEAIQLTEGDLPVEEEVIRTDPYVVALSLSEDAYIASAPGQPTIVSPTPTGVTDITLDETPLEWAAGDPAGDTYEVYFRESGDDWVLVGEAQAGVTWTIDFGTLAYETTYEWRIDATNEHGTTEGAIWSFDTIEFDRFRVSYRLLPDGHGAGYGPYDDPPGVEGTDWAWTGENTMLTVRRLIVAVDNKIWVEDL